MKKPPVWLGHILAAIISLLAGFFGVFNVLFSDSSGVREKSGLVLYVLVIYTVCSGLFYWLWPGHGQAWRLWLILPAVAFAMFITLTDYTNFVYPVAIIAAVIGGSWLGSSIFNRQKHD